MTTDILILPDAPAIAGLEFRHIRGAEDAEALYAIHLERMDRDQVDPLSGFEDAPPLEALCEMLTEAINEGQQNFWLVAQVAQRVIGYTQIEGWAEDDGTWVYLILGWVTPAWRGQGIGTAMLHWAEAFIRQRAATEHPGAKIELAANASSTERDTTALLLHEGYVAGYNVLEMGLDTDIPLQELPLPAGIEIHPALPEHYLAIAESVQMAYEQEYEEGKYQEAFDPAEFAENLCAPKYDPTLWQIAWDGAQIVGQVLTVVGEKTAEVFEVSVHPAWRRRGLARSLLSRALCALRARNINVIRLHTVAEFRTRASDLYRSVGFRILKEFPRYRKALE